MNLALSWRSKQRTLHLDFFVTSAATDTTYGPEDYVIQFHYDDVGRVVRKVVLDSAVDESKSSRYESKYEFDGRGQLTREQILKYNVGTDRMEILQDVQKTYDLGGNVLTVKFSDNHGWAFTETRTYANGYQLTGVAESHRTSGSYPVTVNQGGSYTYDTNNNLTGTESFDAFVPADADRRLANRAEWTFTYDKITRLKSYTHTAASDVRGNLSYDGRGRIWQRWNDNSDTSYWDATLTRFVYDGSQLVQEILFDVEDVEGSWVYTYNDLTRDYLRQSAGMRQRERDGGDDTDYYMQANRGVFEFKTERDPVAATIDRDFKSSALDQISGSTFQELGNLTTSGSYVEMYGGTKSGDTAGFDPLVQMGGGHYLGGLGRTVNYGFGGGGFGGGSGGGASNPQAPGGGLPVPPGNGNGFGGGFGEPPSSGNGSGYKKLPPGRKGKRRKPHKQTPTSKCNCEDCLELLKYCIISFLPGQSMWQNFYNFCCIQGIAACPLILDPCAPASSCRDLLCGPSMGRCFCDAVVDYSQDDPHGNINDEHDIRKAIHRCGLCVAGIFDTNAGACDDEFHTPMIPGLVNLCEEADCDCVDDLRRMTFFECCYYLEIKGLHAWESFIDRRHEWCEENCDLLVCEECCKIVVDIEKGFCENLDFWD